MALVVLSGSCKRPPATEASDRKSGSPSNSAADAALAIATPVDERATGPASSGSSGSDAPPSARRYQWLSAQNLKFPAPTSSLEARFAVPPGYHRVGVPPGSFAEWLRGVPLAAPGTPVVTNSGETVFAGNDDHIAAVLAIDVGVGDLQQSADAVVRLHGEWLWASGATQGLDYVSATRLDLPFSRWAKGQRLMAAGGSVFWVVKSKPRDPTYNDFRQYIDAVMLWSNSVSLATRAAPVTAPKELVAGDFFLETRGKGHAVLVLDVAEKPTGERVALLGQARQSPAQSIHVLQLGPGVAWFSLRPPSALLTPDGDQFSWEELRRLGSPSSAPD